MILLYVDLRMLIIMFLHFLTLAAVNILFETRIVTRENAEHVSFAMSRQAGITHLKEIIIRLAENSSDPKCVAERRSEFNITVNTAWMFCLSFRLVL